VRQTSLQGGGPGVPKNVPVWLLEAMRLSATNSEAGEPTQRRAPRIYY
jgi:hypothetical protein